MSQYKEHQLWWDENLQVVRAIGVGTIDEESASWFYEQTVRMAHEYGDQLNWLLDLSQITKTSSKARKILMKASSHPSIRKYAMVGASTFIRTVANFISAAAGQKNAHHFSTFEEALDWIHERGD